VVCMQSTLMTVTLAGEWAGGGVSSCGADPLCGAAPSRGEKTSVRIVVVITN
jgi:hypothetical protein